MSLPEPEPHTSRGHKHTKACRSADDVLASVEGLTYRQLDWWTTRGYLRVTLTHPGHGVYRCWPESEIAVLRRTLQLIEHGFQASKAIELARHAAVLGVLDALEATA